MSEQTGLPELQSDDWSKSFYLLAEKINKGRVVLLFDEISWMGSEDSDFLGKIKNAWDIKFKKNKPSDPDPLKINIDEDIYSPFLKSVKWQKGKNK